MPITKQQTKGSWIARELPSEFQTCSSLEKLTKDELWELLEKIQQYGSKRSKRYQGAIEVRTFRKVSCPISTR